MNNYYPQMGYTMQNNPYMQNYQQQYQMMNQQMNTQSQQDTLQGKIVDSVDVVRAMNVDMSGQPTYYPKSDKSEIYCKQLNPQTGASYISTYKLVENTKSGYNDEKNTQIGDILIDLKKEIEEVKNIVLENFTNPKGGV